MAKSVNDVVLDAMLGRIDDATNMTVCSAEPTTKTQADTTFKLAAVAPTFQAPANGDVSGRKLVMDAKNGVAVDTSGTANHIALTDGSALLYVTTCNSQSLTQGNTVNIPSWKIEVADPA